MSDMRGDARGGVVGARIYGPVELALGTCRSFLMSELLLLQLTFKVMCELSCLIAELLSRDQHCCHHYCNFFFMGELLSYFFRGELLLHV